MDLRDLWYFQAVAETANLGRAAALVHRTQPALTKSVQRLENELGTALFERTGRRLKLTSVGQVLLGRARQLRRSVEETTREIHDHAAGEVGTVRIGASVISAEAFLPRLVSRLSRQSPGISLQVLVDTNDVLERMLLAGELDLVLSPLSPNVPGVGCKAIEKDSVVIVASADHPLLERQRITFPHLRGYRWVLPASNIASRAWLDRAFESHGMEPLQVQVELGAISLIPKLITGTTLLSFLSRRNLAARASTLREVRVGGVAFHRSLGLHWRQEGYLSPAALRVREFVLEPE